MRIRVTSKAQNGILAEYVEKCGSIRAAAKLLAVAPFVLGRWLNFREAPTPAEMKSRPGVWKRRIIAMEKETGHSFFEIFPELPSGVLKMLSTPRVKTADVTLEQLTSSVEQLHLTYEQDFNQVTNRELSSACDEVMGCLTERERKVIQMRNGFPPYTEPQILYEVGIELGIGKETVRQIESKAIRKMQRPDVAKLIVEHAESITVSPRVTY